MSFYAYDVSGYVGDVASVVGWADFCDWAEGAGGEVSSLTNDGVSNDPAALAQQLGGMSAPDPDVEAVRVGLLGLAQKAKELLIVSEGES